MQRRVGGDRRGERSRAGGAHRRRTADQSRALRARHGEQEPDRQQACEPQHRRRAGRRGFERQQHQPSQTRLQRQSRADGDDEREQHQAEQGNELGPDQVSGA